MIKNRQDGRHIGNLLAGIVTATKTPVEINIYMWLNIVIMICIDDYVILKAIVKILFYKGTLKSVRRFSDREALLKLLNWVNNIFFLKMWMFARLAGRRRGGGAFLVASVGYHIFIQSEVFATDRPLT